MKIGDVEYQGDKTKATFYYIADKRVDFRQLIKKYAEDFRIRVEMRQIGARQEASKIGGIGACGRELCCASWLTDFKSVTTRSAKACRSVWEVKVLFEFRVGFIYGCFKRFSVY